MSKVFRLYNIQGDNTILDWQASKVYGTQAISEITDPDGADAKKEITSIPSPFARIDLIKTAFREVVAMTNRNPNDKDYASFDGDTIYHKMVSDMLDVAEIFFNYDRFKDFFEIIVWDRQRDLDGNNVFGKTLKRYLESDATGGDPYNFGKLDRIYLLNYIGPDRPAAMNIVGATSPATLFFSSANDLNYVSKNIAFGLDKPFDVEYQPLYKRDFEFQKYLYAFRIAYGAGAFHKDFPEVDDYLTSSTGKVCNYKLLSPKQKNEIDGLSIDSINQYQPILIGTSGQNTFEILGRPFHKRPNVIKWQSDFEIKSALYTGSPKPLVLPVEMGSTYANRIYTTDLWGKDNKAPYYDHRPWQNRTLPIVNEAYPYLTVSDFLTDTIVRMPYEIDGNNFFDGHINKTNGNSYLLPLKETFFHFFTVNDLTGTVAGSRNMFELEDKATGVTAVLRIPVRNGYIEYRRTYFEAGADASDTKYTNDGAILDKKIGLGLMPLIIFPENVDKCYRIALFEKGRPKGVKLSCYKGINPVVEEAHIIRDENNLNTNVCSKESYVINDNFDRIDVAIDDIQGVIVPKFKATGGNKIYTFAIDFGTTNSHIEYGCVTQEGTSPSTSDSFDMPVNEKQMHRLHTRYSDLDINKAFVHNFVPDTIGDKKDDDFSFPMRTVFSEWNQNNPKNKMYALANGNIPFLYEKDLFPDTYNEPRTELKWRGEDEDYLVKLYLENIFLLLRNKVILNGGNLKATKVIWFYPASMDTGKFDNFNKYWKDFYEKYFGHDADKNLISISESAAPHRYYKRKKAASSEVVTIDVGGGTTDIYIVADDKPKMLLSFLFASNAIFGDGGIGDETRWDSDSNGFIQCYYDKFKDILDTVDDDLAATLQQIERHKNSSDIIAFLFSLYGIKKVKGNESLNFLSKLSDNRKLKYVFILFYGAILYYIAKSMKTKGLNRPLTLAFSGNGSKTLRVLSSNNNTIGEFAKLIFNGVYKETESDYLDIIFEDEPKKATSKGGILNATPQTPADIKKIKFTLIGDNMNTASSNDVKFEEITEDIQKHIVDSVVEFVDFLFELHDKNDEFFTTSLNADDDIIDKVKKICKDRVQMEQSLKSVLSHKRGNKKVEETLFFYPLIGVLHELAQKVNKL